MLVRVCFGLASVGIFLYPSMFGLGLSVFPGVLSIALSLSLYWFRRVSAWKP